MITLSTKMSDLLLSDVYTLSIFKRLNIPLGFGDKTVEEVCIDQEINPKLFLYIARLFFYGELPDNIVENKALLPDLVDYLRLTHQYYLTNQIPLLEKYIKALGEKESDRESDLNLLKMFFQKYNSEFVNHIENEEKNVFPYVLEIYESKKSGICNNELLSKIEKRPIAKFEKEHDNLDEKLNDLKNIIIKYLPPFKNSYEIYQILIILFHLEKDIFEHAQLEDIMMTPAVAEIEKELISLYKL
jgi:regulator of cell morphogenesis and NO signaling